MDHDVEARTPMEHEVTEVILKQHGYTIAEEYTKRYLPWNKRFKGGMAHVMPAYDKERGGPENIPNVAIKIARTKSDEQIIADELEATGKKFLTDQELRDLHQKEINKVQKEIDIQRSLDHPNILKIYDTLTVIDNNTGKEVQAFTTDYLPPEYNLSEQIKSKKDFSNEEVDRNIVEQGCDVISYLASRNPPILHRDIKPSSFFIVEGELKVGDFSVSDTSGVQDGSGTLRYAAPDRFVEGLTETESSEVYSLAAVVYETVTGERYKQMKKNDFDSFVDSYHQQNGLLVDSDNWELADKFYNKLLEKGASEDEANRKMQALHKALSRDPQDRYQTAKEFADDFLDRKQNI